MVDQNEFGDVNNDRQFALPGTDIIPIVTRILLVINGIIWLASTLTGADNNSESLLNFGAMFSPLISDGQYWRLFTAMFLHVGGSHIFFNSLALLIFGQLVEKHYGHVRFLIIYILAGLAGSVASYILNPIAIAAGASGAVFGILGALAAFLVTQRKVFGKMALHSLYGLIILGSINLLYGFFVPGIDNWAHIGGLVTGFALGMFLTPKYTTQQTVFGAQITLPNPSSQMKNWSITPIVVIMLLVGTWIGSATMPDNSYSHVLEAERLFNQKDMDRARTEISKAFPLDASIRTNPSAVNKAVELFVLLGGGK